MWYQIEASLPVNTAVLKLSAKELALPSKEEDFRAGNNPFLGLKTELLQMVRNSQCLLKGTKAKRETWDRLIKYRYGAELDFYHCNRGES